MNKLVPRVLSRIAELPFRLRRITRGGSYRPEIDGLRFIAIALVVVGHIASRAEHSQSTSFAGDTRFTATYRLLDIQGTGVLLFFAISGFIIAAQFLAFSSHPFSAKFLGPYYLRRVSRIEPPYFVLLVATFLLLTSTGYAPVDSTRFVGGPSLNKSLLASLFYAHDYIYGKLPRLFPPGWSLEIEVQFYVFAPLFFYIYFTRVAGNRRLAVGALAGLAAIIFSGWIGSLNNQHLQLTLLRYFPYFWTGIVLAAASRTYPNAFTRLPVRGTSLAAWAALIFFVIFSSLEVQSVAMTDIAMAGSVISVVVMFLGSMNGGGSFRAFCSHPWTSLIGGACYSLYLTHLQIAQLLTHLLYRLTPMQHLPWMAGLAVVIVIEIPIVCAVGLVFYALIERPFMRPNWPKLAMRRVANLFGIAPKSP